MKAKQTKSYTMRNKVFILFFILVSFLFTSSAQENLFYITKTGELRWKETEKEASFYGVNYTVPFAHAYRALNYLGLDHKQAIDKDVYHMARLGFNAYRIHLWDVELSDAKGNLINNEHLDLLDYLISKLEDRGIYVLITAMTNFGNGYPERNMETDGFSYLYDKCEVHSNAEAIKAQQRYLSQLVNHTNRYTDKKYKDDPYIVGFEINNEPCHQDSPKQTRSYINKMLSALKNAGNSKPVFYNVSHNLSHVNSYFDTAIDGVTFQWYPIGLVAGKTRKGNFLPAVDNYSIPFSNLPNYSKKVKAIYEYDPADITYSYMYPAMTRSFRTQGFQWITQFAYDPIDIAWANTEYQTHFLNLAYTPNKAVSMAIAAEVAYNVPLYKKYESYPKDTIFDGFRVSYSGDLSEYKSLYKFFYSNTTTSAPHLNDSLKQIIGCGNSPIVKYEGTGAYFLDQLEEGVWRLEVMPDAIEVSDPFETPSLDKEVVTVAWNSWPIQIELNDLGLNYSYKGLNENNVLLGEAQDKGFLVSPGVYLLTNKQNEIKNNWMKDSIWKNIKLGEYVAPNSHAKSYSINHEPYLVIEEGDSLCLNAIVVGSQLPDSILIYNDKISFWSEYNPYLKMSRVENYKYQAIVPKDWIKEGVFRYNMVVFSEQQSMVFPGRIKGHPLDWDYYKKQYWETKVVSSNTPIELFNVVDEYSQLDTYAIPETSTVSRRIKNNALSFSFNINDEAPRFYWKKYIRKDVEGRLATLNKTTHLKIQLNGVKDITRLKVGFTTSLGISYTSEVAVDKKQMIQVDLKTLQQDKSILLPAPYPVFLSREFESDQKIPFSIQDIEFLELSTIDSITEQATIAIERMWLE